MLAHWPRTLAARSLKLRALMHGRSYGEETKFEVEYVDTAVGRHHYVRRLQKEGGATAAAPTPSAAGTNGIADSEPQHGRPGTVHNLNVADHQHH